MHVYVRVHVQVRGQPQVSPSETLSTSLEAGSLIGLELTKGEAGWPPGSRDAPVLFPQRWDYKYAPPCPALLHELRVLNLGPHTLQSYIFLFQYFPYNIKSYGFPVSFLLIQFKIGTYGAGRYGSVVECLLALTQP